MKNFFYKGIDLNGKEISGYLLAEDKSIAENILNNKGIIIEKIVNHRFFFNYIKPKNNFEFFIKSLSDLLSSGLPLTDALEFISNGKAGKSIQNEGLNIFEDIKNGNPLHVSMKKFFPNASKFHLSLITTGESSGNLDKTLKLISEMINENKRIKSELISTLTYPIILFFSMLLLLYFILEFALPRMLNVMDLSGNIPLPTAILLISGNVLPTVIIAIFYLIIFILILIVLKNRIYFFQKFIDKIFLNIPFIKQLIIISSRRVLLQGYTIGLSGGLNISEVSFLVMNSMPNLQIKERIKLLINKIEEGNSFSKALEETSLLNAQQIASIKIADETDKIKENFELLKNQFEIKLSVTLKSTVKIIEPLILIFFGIIILVLALGIILPVLNATSML